MTDLGRRALGWAVAAGLCLLASVPVAAQTTSASVAGQAEGRPGRGPARGDRDVDEPDPGQHADRDGRRPGPLRPPDRPAGCLHAVGEHGGLQDNQRTNVVVNANDETLRRHPDTGGRRISEEVSVIGRVSELQAKAEGAHTRWRARPSRTSRTTTALCSTSPPSFRASPQTTRHPGPR